jgi:hypothetical protein
MTRAGIGERQLKTVNPLSKKKVRSGEKKISRCANENYEGEELLKALPFVSNPVLIARLLGTKYLVLYCSSF